MDSEYNARRQQCEEVARVLDVRALRDVSLEQLNELRKTCQRSSIDEHAMWSPKMLEPSQQ